MRGYSGEFEKQSSLKQGGISVRNKWLRAAQTEGEKEQKKSEEQTQSIENERLQKINEMVNELRDILKWYRNVSIPDAEGKNIAGWLEKQFKEKYEKTSTSTDVSGIIDKVAFSAANTYMSGIKWVSGQWTKEDRDKVKNTFKKYLEWYAKSVALPQRQTPEEIKRKRKIDEALGFLTEEVVKKKLEQKEDALDELLKHVKKKSFYVEAMVKQDVIDTIQNIFGPSVLTKEIEDLVDKADRLFEKKYNELVFDVTLSESAIKKQLYEIADQIAEDTAQQLNETAQRELGKTFPTLYSRVYNTIKSYFESKIEKRFGSKSKWLL